MWAELRGKWGYVAGTSGTASLPKGVQVISIYMAGSGGSMTINGGDSIVMPATNAFQINFRHLLLVAPTLVFSSTSSYFVEYVDPTSFAYP